MNMKMNTCKGCIQLNVEPGWFRTPHIQHGTLTPRQSRPKTAVLIGCVFYTILGSNI